MQTEHIKLRWEEDGFFKDENGKSVPVEVTITIVMVKGEEERARKAILKEVNRWFDEAIIIGE